MHITFGRKSRLFTLGAGLAAAAAFALSTAGPALADTADTGGTGTISVSSSVLNKWATSGIMLLAGAPATSSFANGANSYTLNVTGGTGEVSNFTGIVQFGGGTLVFVNAATGTSVTVTGVQLNYFTGRIQGVLPGSTAEAPLAYLNGTMSSSVNAGPPETETFSCDAIDLSTKAATALNAALGTHAFTHGTDLGGFTTTYDVTVS